MAKHVKIMLCAIFAQMLISCGTESRDSVGLSILEFTSTGEITEYHIWAEIKPGSERDGRAGVIPAKSIVHVEGFFNNTTQDGVTVFEKELDKIIELDEFVKNRRVDHSGDWYKTGIDHMNGQSVFVHVKSGMRPAGERLKTSVTAAYSAGDTQNTVYETATR